MQYIKQDDFDSFSCIADKCPSSCCIGWQIVIDDKSLDNYLNFKGEMSNRLLQDVDYKEGVFKHVNRRCAMLNDKNLCDLQLSAGHEALCYTCRRYPRHEEEFEDVREESLSLSCPEVAKMMVEKQDKMSFSFYETDEEDDFEEFDYYLYTQLLDARKLMIDIAQDRELKLEDRMTIILKLSKDMQELLDQDSLCDMGALLEKYKDKDFQKGISKDGYPVLDTDKLYKLERLDDSWNVYLDTANDYYKCQKQEASFAVMNKEEETALEQVLVLLLFIYFCGSVYDDMIYSKAALCTYCVQWILNIYMAMTKGQHDKDILIKTIYSFAREVEHSDLNLDALEDMFYEMIE